MSYNESQPSSSSLTTRSNLSTIKQVKKAQLAKKKKAEKASRLSEEPTKEVPPHLVSHMLPFFYPNDYEDEPAAEYDEHEVPRHLVSHMTPYCFPISGTFDDKDIYSPQSEVVVPRHLEQHVSLYCQPLDDNGDVSEWSTNDDNKRPKQRRTNFVPRHLETHVILNENVDGDGADVQRRRPGICCDMTRDHANMRDSLFPADDQPVLQRVGGRRPVANRVDLFEESKPKPRPMSITIVDREPEDTKENIFGSGSVKTLRSRRRWEKDTKKSVFNVDSDGEQTTSSTRLSSRYENTQEKLFGETYGIKEAEENYLRRRRPFREDTQMTLFGPPAAPTPQRPQSAQSLTSTYENLFGMPPATPSNTKRALTLKRENTFNNLFGSTEAHPFNASETEGRYTPKNPKLVQVTFYIHLFAEHFLFQMFKVRIRNGLR